MKKYIVIAVIMATALFGANKVAAQQEAESMIPIAVCVPESIEFPSVATVLESRLNTAAMRGGLAGGEYAPRFVMFPIISVLSEQRTTTPPIMTIVELEVSVYIADYKDEHRYAATSFTVKGGGQSKEKAYIDAVKKIGDNKQMQGFVQEGRKRILDYYNTMCEKMLDEANALAVARKYIDAFSLIAEIPQVSACFSNSRTRMAELYSQYYDLNCSADLEKAKSLYAQRDITGALDNLSAIYPGCQCYTEAQKLYSDIVKYVENEEAEVRNAAKEEAKNAREDSKNDRLREHELALKALEVELAAHQEKDLQEQMMADRAYELAKMTARMRQLPNEMIQGYIVKFDANKEESEK